MSTETNIGAGATTIVTAGNVNEYIAKLSKLGKAALEGRIAKLKKKISWCTKAIQSGKFVAVGKKGPKNARQAAWALRGCENALKWHEAALAKAA